MQHNIIKYRQTFSVTKLMEHENDVKVRVTNYGEHMMYSYLETALITRNAIHVTK
jgi:hypothetical protein